ncbi:SpoIVB peptidase [Ethanoligenens harbinense]|uniref:Stage IV sporulation protein B n=1 Tax=Ethanoligenens harbinense (strain DSM 18485 / JCM 12961 / CGMCC 1.5033 / YUAN-3) TaxID=663278 RepID=E6U2J4_ETHHY|nr:SpoIVB peptidase [Ethanoligenens harbinense]ADU26285.1 stage IV sporulation protein B [Ethanoligenens harbinense YUAN-3]
MKKYLRSAWVLAGMTMLSAVLCGELFAGALPDTLQVHQGQTLQFAGLPLSSTQDGAVSAGRTLRAGATYTADVRLLGLFQVKNVRVQVVPARSVVPDGEPFGIKLYTEGVMVVGITDVDTAAGKQSPAAEAGIRKGDILVAINGQTVNSNTEVGERFAGSAGEVCTLSMRRGGMAFQTRLRPRQSVTDGVFKAGLWVRDSTAGIGTVTYFDPQNGVYAGLGHPVCDADTGKVLPLLEGEAVNSTITGVDKGTKGKTGELIGTLADAHLGSLLINGSTGVYGVLTQPRAGKSYPVATRQQVHVGKATMLVTTDEAGPRAYAVCIEQVRYGSGSGEHNMVVRVTDPALISRTGGIVQGMSGSPLLQDGMFIGAVTHVFVNDPEKGYAIFAENMLQTAQTLAERH